MFLIFAFVLSLSKIISTSTIYDNSLSNSIDNYYYPDYVFNYSSPVYSTRQKRIFDEDISLRMKFRMTIYSYIPITQLGSTVTVIIPFSFSLPSVSSSSRSARSLTSDQDDDYPLPSRGELYTMMEDYVANMLGINDGHSCLLRAMCEVSSTPLHDEGLIGDALNFLLTGTYSAPDKSDVAKEYFEAQAEGQLSGDCRPYHHECPISLFKYI